MKYIKKNLTDIFIFFILVSVTFLHYLYHFQISLLNFYHLPIMISGYLLGRRLAILYAFFTVLLVWVFILANQSIYHALQDQFQFNIDLTLWGGFLILSGWAGSLSENLRTELRTSDRLRIELAQDKSNLKELNEKLNEANELLAEKVAQRTKELEESHEELKQLSMTDPLTGLFNRRSCEEKFQNEINRFKRTQESFSIILSDIDHFKKINDNYGHNIGDQVLVETARIIKNYSRKTDMVFRWGGEEFLFILTGTEINGGVIVGEKIRSSIEKNEFLYNGNNVPVTMSFGVSIYEEGQTMEECIAQADENLYKAKKAGRNRVVSTQSQ
jgi:diguanylate cyclase (GGDEF)-like protein